MATNYFDRYGNYQGKIPSLPGEIIPYIVEDAGGGITYICFFPDDANGKRLVKRITESSSGGATITTIEHAYGAWDDRESLTYYPINQAIPVEEE